MVLLKMNQKLHFSIKKIRAFTLLELLLSLVVLVILLMSFLSYTQKAQQRNTIALAKTQMNVLLTAAIQYNSIYLQWPTTLSALIPLLGTDTSKTPSFCSPWRTSSNNCAAYTIANTTNYFALKVTTPSLRSAQDLVTALQNAYIDTDNKTVVAYVTAFSKPHRPRPTGVMYGSNQFSGSTCDTSSTPGTRSTGPYGLLNIMDNSSSAVHACANNMKTSISYNPNAFSCPPNSQPTMLLLPVGLIPYAGNAVSSGMLYYDYRYVSNSSASLGPYLELHVNSYTYSSYGYDVPFLDIMCLEPSNIRLWPNPYYPYSFSIS
jgi:type II secretory pathway pseudopilin PulG